MCSDDSENSEEAELTAFVAHYVETLDEDDRFPFLREVVKRWNPRRISWFIVEMTLEYTDSEFVEFVNTLLWPMKIKDDVRRHLVSYLRDMFLDR